MSWRMARRVRIAAWIRWNVWSPKAKGESALPSMASCRIELPSNFHPEGNHVSKWTMPVTRSVNRPTRHLKTEAVSSGDSVSAMGSLTLRPHRHRSAPLTWTMDSTCRICYVRISVFGLPKLMFINPGVVQIKARPAELVPASAIEEEWHPTRPCRPRCHCTM